VLAAKLHTGRISQIELQSSCKIAVEKADNIDGSKTIVITGPLVKINEACMAVMNVIQEVQSANISTYNTGVLQQHQLNQQYLQQLQFQAGQASMIAAQPRQQFSSQHQSINMHSGSIAPSLSSSVGANVFQHAKSNQNSNQRQKGNY
jgi:hypothetical protein